MRLRVVLLVLAACAVAPAPATAEVTWSYDEATATLSVTMTGKFNDRAILDRDGDVLRINGEATPARVSTTKAVQAKANEPSSILEVELSGGPLDSIDISYDGSDFGPGWTDKPWGHLYEDGLIVNLPMAASHVTATEAGINVNAAGDDDVDITTDSVERVWVIGNGGQDLIDGSEYGHQLILDGGGEDDTLIGGRGNDSFIGRAGADTMRGGPGDDDFSAMADNNIDTLDCGEGHDRYDADDADKLTACEEVRRVVAQAGTGPTPGSRPAPPPLPGFTPLKPRALEVLTRPVLRVRGGRIRVPLLCNGPAACRGSVTLRAAGRRAAQRSFALTPASHATVSLRLSRAARRALARRGRLRAVVSAAGVTRRVTLRA
jgi:RTX calcium-binding nonapeptide repeat (4 copies)